jgi:hypothetical protein
VLAGLGRINIARVQAEGNGLMRDASEDFVRQLVLAACAGRTVCLVWLRVLRVLPGRTRRVALRLLVPSLRTPIAKAPDTTLDMNGQRNMDRELVILRPRRSTKGVRSTKTRKLNIRLARPARSTSRNTVERRLPTPLPTCNETVSRSWGRIRTIRDLRLWWARQVPRNMHVTCNPKHACRGGICLSRGLRMA